VLKCIYQFLEPKRWDVVVFKNPLDPTINYIKRLIALPNETVEIIDGDIYIDGKIARKPEKVQDELWMPIFANDFQPARPLQGKFNGHLWQQPFNTENSAWQIKNDNPTVFVLDSDNERMNSMSYDTTVGNDFRATYAYNDISAYQARPFCSDLMVRFYARVLDEAVIGIELSKYQNRYRARVDSAGAVSIEKIMSDGLSEQLVNNQLKGSLGIKPVKIKFSNVDHLLTLQVGSEKFDYDLGPSANDAGPRQTAIEPRVTIFGSGKLELSHAAIFRDIHYTSSKYGNGPPEGRAVEGYPFPLKEDQFFMLGDNSPSSEDGRWWDQKGIANKGNDAYDAGIVPREYLVGKALFVYWPSGYEFPWPYGVRAFFAKNRRNNRLMFLLNEIFFLNWIPNVGQMRFIYGGSERNE